MRKVLFTLLVAGAALCATSCFDNLEPTGLEQMRGAKAELLSAKAALKLAEVKIKEANALKLTAMAAYRQAEADQKKILNERRAADNYYLQQLEQIELSGDTLALRELEKTHEKKIQNLTNRLERVAAKHEEAMTTLQKELAVAETDYHEALADLEYARSQYAGTTYSAELATLISDLSDCRDEISTCLDNIAFYQRQNLSISTFDIPELERMLNDNVAKAEEDVKLKHEKVELLKAARDANKEGFEALVAENKEKMDELVANWATYTPAIAELNAQIKQKRIEVAELQYLFDAKYDDNQAAGHNPSDPGYDPDYTDGNDSNTYVDRITNSNQQLNCCNL